MYKIIPLVQMPVAKKKLKSFSYIWTSKSSTAWVGRSWKIFSRDWAYLVLFKSKILN